MQRRTFLTRFSVLATLLSSGVKAQTAAIYRKANVTGRPQLLSLFIDDMMGGAPVGGTQSAPKTTAAKAAR